MPNDEPKTCSRCGSTDEVAATIIHPETPIDVRGGPAPADRRDLCGQCRHEHEMEASRVR